MKVPSHPRLAFLAAALALALRLALHPGRASAESPPPQEGGLGRGNHRVSISPTA